jgi:hypothetical protein
MRNNPVLTTVLTELRTVGAAYRVERGSRHWKVFWSGSGAKEITVVSVTASNRWAPLQALSLLRRQLRVAGISSRSHGGAPGSCAAVKANKAPSQRRSAKMAGQSAVLPMRNS